MTKRYICDLCWEPCILEVEKDADIPLVCPYNDEVCDKVEWKLLKEEDKNNESN